MIKICFSSVGLWRRRNPHYLWFWLPIWRELLHCSDRRGQRKDSTPTKGTQLYSLYKNVMKIYILFIDIAETVLNK